MRTRIVLLLSCCVIVIVGLIAIILQQSQPLTALQKERALTKLLGHKPTLTAIPRSSNWVTYNGTYLTFTYPAAASIYRSQKEQDQFVVENFQFQERMPKYFFVVQVLSLPDMHHVSDIPAVSLRRIQKDIYTEGKLSLGSISAVTFVKTDDGFEKTAFILVNRKAYTFSITTDDPSREELFDTIVASVQIK